MKRLTGHNSFGGVYAIGMGCKNKTDTIDAILRRLAAYEDTGLTPEDLKPGLNAAVRKKLACEYFGLSTSQASHIEELVQADKDGRVMILPCKMGMTAWAAVGGRVIEISVTGIKAGAAGRIYTADLDCESGCSIEECGGCEVYEWYDAHRGNEGEVELTEEDFGKTVFFDREEAEKAANGGHGNG